MNFFTSADEIINLPISEKERNHHSRDRHAYHVYLSRFCKRYQSLNDREKREVLEQLGVWRIQQHAGYDSDDSIVSVPKASSGQLMKAAGRVWRDYTTIEMKDAWRERTRRLNELPVVDGTFDYVPCAVGGEDTEHLEKKYNACAYFGLAATSTAIEDVAFFKHEKCDRVITNIIQVWKRTRGIVHTMLQKILYVISDETHLIWFSVVHTSPGRLRNAIQIQEGKNNPHLFAREVL